MRLSPILEELDTRLGFNPSDDVCNGEPRLGHVVRHQGQYPGNIGISSSTDCAGSTRASVRRSWWSSSPVGVL